MLRANPDLPALPKGKEATLGLPQRLLVVGCFNVCDGDLLKFLSCPPQRVLLSWNWRVNAAIRRNILDKTVQIKKKKSHGLKKNHKLILKPSSPPPHPTPELPPVLLGCSHLWEHCFSTCPLNCWLQTQQWLCQEEREFSHPDTPASLIPTSKTGSVLYKLFFLQLKKKKVKPLFLVFKTTNILTLYF